MKMLVHDGIGIWLAARRRHRASNPDAQHCRPSCRAWTSITNPNHEPESTTCTRPGCGCGCALKRIGEDVSEKLDYTPGLCKRPAIPS